MPDASDFYARLPVFEGFANIMDPAHYRPLPDDWLVGLTDVVSSTQAISDGRFHVPAGEPGMRPDLTGLSCRWNDIPAERGVIVSLLVAPARHDDPRFRTFVEGLLRQLEGNADVARPVPAAAPGLRWPPPGLDLEARASRKSGESVVRRRISVAWSTLVAYVVMRFGIRFGSFDPAIYRRDVVENSD